MTDDLDVITHAARLLTSLGRSSADHYAAIHALTAADLLNQVGATRASAELAPVGPTPADPAEAIDLALQHLARLTARALSDPRIQDATHHALLAHTCLTRRRGDTR